MTTQPAPETPLPDLPRATLPAVFSASEAAQWSGGTWQNLPAEPLLGITTDSRNVRPGSLFVALRGERHDAHRFVPAALAAGAAAATVERDAELPFADTDVAGRAPLLRVSNTLAALTALAAGYRKAVGATIVGVTGSAGKTTVKDFTARLLAPLAPTAKTVGNFNNEVGLPISLLAMPRDAVYGVFEAGMSHPGEIAPLAATMAPDIAILTNAGPVHLEALGTVDNVANEKADILRALPATGFAVLDRSSPYFDFWRECCPCAVVSVAVAPERNPAPDADFVATPVDEAAGHFTVRVRGSDAEHPFESGVPGLHNILNATYAIAVARRLGADWDLLRTALPCTARQPMRWEVAEDSDGVQIINDAYNANPMSMARALELFALVRRPGRRIAVVGDMLELGADEERMHRETGAVVARTRPDLLVTVGDRATRWIAEGATDAGYPADRVRRFATAAEAAPFLRGIRSRGDVIFLKASRGIALEKALG